MANIMTPVFRVNYPSVFKPRKNKFNDKLEYSLVALFPKSADLSVLKNAVIKAASEKWGDNQAKWPAKLKLPLKDQADFAKEVNEKIVLPDGHEVGAMYLSLKSEQKPGLVNHLVEDIIDPTEFYSGCYARATVQVYAYDKGSVGVAIKLVNIQKVKEGDTLGNRTKPQDDFAPITGTHSEGSTASDLFS